MKRRVLFDEDITLRGAINIAKACAANVINDKGHIGFEVILNSRKVYCIQPLGTHKMFKSHQLVTTIAIQSADRRPAKRKTTRRRSVVRKMNDGRLPWL